MTYSQFKRIDKRSYTQNGVLIVTLPLNNKGGVVIDGNDKYMFINSRLREKSRTEAINLGFQKLGVAK